MSTQATSFLWKAQLYSTCGRSAAGRVTHPSAKSGFFHVQDKSYLSLPTLEKTVAHVASCVMEQLLCAENYEYHLLEEGRHYILCVLGVLWIKEKLQIRRVGQYSFVEMKKLFECTGQKLELQEFKTYVQKLPLIHIEEKLPLIKT